MAYEIFDLSLISRLQSDKLAREDATTEDSILACMLNCPWDMIEICFPKDCRSKMAIFLNLDDDGI